MYKVTVMYPNEEGVRFDFDYYRNKHMKLVAEQFRPFGLTKTGVEKGISGGAGQSVFYATADCSLGAIVIAATTKGVCLIQFGEDAGALDAQVRATFPNLPARPFHPCSRTFQA